MFESGTWQAIPILTGRQARSRYVGGWFSPAGPGQMTRGFDPGYEEPVMYIGIGTVVLIVIIVLVVLALRR